MNILAIESSCDETAASVIHDTEILSSVVSSSASIHEKYGGVIPEIAARKQVEFIIPVIKEALGEIPVEQINSIAVTVGPGLMGSLLVGVEAAKALSLAWDKPIIPVNHLVGHIYANFVKYAEVIKLDFPAVVLVVSGGHTDLILMKDHFDFEYLGGTLDDAAGEAFDKVARLLGISRYLGGVRLSKKASECQDNILDGRLPRPLLNKNNFDFSFSGLKTAVKRIVEIEDPPVDSVACEFENAVCDVLIVKTIKAVKKYNAKSILLGGGVAANTQLRERFQTEAGNMNVVLSIPKINLCGDNAVYIGVAAYFKHKVFGTKAFVSLDNIKANPSLGIMDRV